MGVSRSASNAHHKNCASPLSCVAQNSFCAGRKSMMGFSSFVARSYAPLQGMRVCEIFFVRGSL